MKRITIIATVATVLFLAAFVIVRADTRNGQSWRGQRWHRFGPMNFLAHELKLSDAQRMQIQALWQAERPTFAAHVHEFLAENKEMNAIAAHDNPDPSEVQKLADRLATTIASLLVEKEQLQSKIYTTVLNPAQRLKADDLREKWESRLDHAAGRLGTKQAEK